MLNICLKNNLSKSSQFSIPIKKGAAKIKNVQLCPQIKSNVHKLKVTESCISMLSSISMLSIDSCKVGGGQIVD